MVIPEDVISDSKGVVYLGGNKISPLEIASLYEEIKALERMRVWSVMHETLRARAMDMAFNKSLSFDDLKTAKMMLYNLDVMQSIVTTIKKISLQK
jgi:hypothetical protein